MYFYPQEIKVFEPELKEFDGLVKVFLREKSIF
jgi:hypothetical protein